MLVGIKETRKKNLHSRAHHSESGLPSLACDDFHGPVLVFVGPPWPILAFAGGSTLSWLPLVLTGLHWLSWAFVSMHRLLLACINLR